MIWSILNKKINSPCNYIDTENEEGKVFEYLLSISKKDDGNVVSTYELLSDGYKENTLPFGMDSFGNYTCFRYDTQNDGYRVKYLLAEIF